MGKQSTIVTSITDDLDGTELPENAVPIIIGKGGSQWEIYLSAKNMAELEDKYLNNASPIRGSDGTRQTGSRKKGQSDAAAIRWWAREKNIKDDEGNEISAKGKVRPDWVARWEAAGSPRP